MRRPLAIVALALALLTSSTEATTSRQATLGEDQA